MSEQRVAPYGSWKSPITTDLVLMDVVRLGQIRPDGDDVYWTEGRPKEGGRNALVRWTPEGGREDVTPEEFSVRSRVHEYGGGSYIVHENEIIFANFGDQRLYRHKPGEMPEPVTPKLPVRFADMVSSPHGHIVCVREDHRPPGEPENTLVRLRLNGEHVGDVLAGGNDFYAAPRFSPDGRYLAWLTWNHPHMPWDGSELWVAEYTVQGELLNAQQVAGGPDESIFQPEWSAHGVLHFVSDRTGWWNLYRWRDGEVEALYPLEAEFGRPQWALGMRTYDFLTPTSILCTVTEQGTMTLARLDTESGRLVRIDLPFTYITDVNVALEGAFFIAGSPTQPLSIVRLHASTSDYEIIRQSSPMPVETGYISIPKTVSFPTDNEQTAYAFFYPPQNQDFRGPEGERPPLIVISHGGPTSMTTATFDLQKQYWTSRGFALLDVNYGGSSGYGRAYRERLYGKWGIVDVKDCINGARYLAQQGLVDEARMAIRGGSAGGYTTLSALTFHDLFSAGASYYGVSDLERLAKETHKFESRYLDKLVGPYPERQDLYIARSPIHFIGSLNCPLIIFQGLEDEVVPPSQAQLMYDAVKVKGLPVAYLTFAGEQHGFRRAENIRRTLEAELYFYSKMFHFALADEIEPVPIENLAEQ